MTTDPARRPAVRRFVLVALVVPAALTVVAVVVQLVALPGLPDPVAVHWGASGRPNGFGAAWASPVLTVVVGLALPAAIALSVLPALRRGDRGFAFRLLGATALALATLIAVLATWTLVMQAGLADAADGPSVWAPLIASFIAAIVAGIGGWLLQPGEVWRAAPAPDAVPLKLAPGERAVWMRTSALAPGAVIAIGAAVLILAASVVVIWLVGDPVGAWITTATALVALVLAATTVAFQVRVGDTGLTVVSVLGFPRLRVALGDVAGAAQVSVNPMAEFGGWGIRMAPGRTGVVLRAGEALEVTRRSGRRLTVTVDDAQTAAALLLALARRDAASAPDGR